MTELKQWLVVAAACAGATAGAYTSPERPAHAASVADAVELRLAPIIDELKRLRLDVEALKRSEAKR